MAEMNLPLIHVVGNSHAHSFTGSSLGQFGQGLQSWPSFRSYSLGPVSSVIMSTQKLRMFQRTLATMKGSPGDLVLTPFGEAECRFYIPKCLADAGEAPIEHAPSTEEVFEHHVRGCELIYDVIVGSGYVPVVWSGHPSVMMDPRHDPNMAALGDPLWRAELNAMWASRMRDFASARSALFVDVYQELVDDRGLCHGRNFVDMVHLETAWVSGQTVDQLFLQGAVSAELVELHWQATGRGQGSGRIREGTDWIRLQRARVRRRLSRGD